MAENTPTPGSLDYSDAGFTAPIPQTSPLGRQVIDNDLGGRDGSRGGITTAPADAGGSQLAGSNSGGQVLVKPVSVDPLQDLVLLNVGSGAGVYARREDNTFLLRTLTPGPGVRISISEEEIYFSLKGGEGSTSFFQLSDAPDPTGQGGKVLALNEEASELVWVDVEGGGAASFFELTDAPSGEGQGGKVLSVEADGTTLSWIALPTFEGTTKFFELTDIPTVATNGGKFLALTADATALEWKDVVVPTKLTEMSDVPDTYTGQAGKLLAVNSDEDGVEFIPAPVSVQVVQLTFEFDANSMIANVTDLPAGWAVASALPATNVRLTHPMNRPPIWSSVLGYQSNNGTLAPITGQNTIKFDKATVNSAMQLTFAALSFLGASASSSATVTFIF